jgi:ribulose bisphosphate carboxylase small subunit
MNDADPLTHVAVFFIPANEGQTNQIEVHLIHTGWRSANEWEEARQWFEVSWRSAFTQLSRQINGLAQDALAE